MFLDRVSLLSVVHQYFYRVCVVEFSFEFFRIVLKIVEQYSQLIFILCDENVYELYVDKLIIMEVINNDNEESVIKCTNEAIEK